MKSTSGGTPARSSNRTSCWRTQLATTPEWREAVVRALQRYAMRHNTRLVTRSALRREELPQIVSETRSQGVTPHQTLSRVLQEMRDEVLLAFVDNAGTYLLLDTSINADPVDVSTRALPTEAIDAGLRNNVLFLSDVPTRDQRVLAYRRRGQDRLRALTLHNYGSTCALCDVGAASLLQTSHILPWGDDPRERGNLRNVICLCFVHHPLFDNGYISLSDVYQVLRRVNTGSAMVDSILNSTQYFRRPSEFCPDPAFLCRHRRKHGFQ